MLIAHAPAGYLLTRILARTAFRDVVRPLRNNRMYQYCMAAGIIGGIAPDFDFIYHLFIDSARTSHHAYLTHMPVFWIAVWGILAITARARKSRIGMAIATIFCASALLHLTLDTLTGVIYWFYPLSHKGVNVFKVADVHFWWVENFTHHWTFFFEIAIVTAAMIVFMRLRETAGEIVRLFRQHGTLRAITARLTVCVFGIVVIALVGSMKFSIDNRAVEKVIRLKHQVVSWFSS